MNTTSRECTQNVQAVDKAFELLETLSEHKNGMSLEQLAARCGLNKNRKQRLAATLCKRGLVEQEKGTGIYRMGIHSVVIAQKFLQNSHLLNHAHPIMAELAKKHGEAVYLTVFKGGEVVFVDMIDSNRNIKATSLVGKKFPFHTNAAGKVLAALDSWDLLEKLLAKLKNRSGGTGLGQLRTELDEIRSKGVAVDVDALGDDISSVAVVVRDYEGKVVGALTMLGPSFRMIQTRLEQEIIPSLCEYAEILSLKFGYAQAT